MVMKGRAMLWLAFIAVGICIVFLLVVHHRYVIDSRELESSIEKEIPPGTSKAAVLEFIKMRHPQFYDDYGTEVKARIHGLADNMIYTKDIVLTFQFDANGKLLSHSLKESMTFF